MTRLKLDATKLRDRLTRVSEYESDAALARWEQIAAFEHDLVKRRLLYGRENRLTIAREHGFSHALSKKYERHVLARLGAILSNLEASR